MEREGAGAEAEREEAAIAAEIEGEAAIAAAEIEGEAEIATAEIGEPLKKRLKKKEESLLINKNHKHNPQPTKTRSLQTL